MATEIGRVTPEQIGYRGEADHTERTDDRSISLNVNEVPVAVELRIVDLAETDDFRTFPIPEALHKLTLRLFVNEIPGTAVGVSSTEVPDGGTYGGWRGHGTHTGAGPILVELPQGTRLVRVDRYRAPKNGLVDNVPSSGATARIEPAPPRAVPVSGGRTVDIAATSPEVGAHEVDEALASRSDAPRVQRALNDIGLRRSKAEWRDSAVTRGEQLDERDHEDALAKHRISSLRERALDLGEAARTLHRSNVSLVNDLNDARRDVRTQAEHALRHEERANQAEALAEKQQARIEDLEGQLNRALRDAEVGKNAAEEARAERDHAQAAHAEANEALSIAQDMVEALGAQPVLGEALRAAIASLISEAGIEVVDGEAAESGLDKVRAQIVQHREQWDNLDRVLPEVQDATDLVDRARKLAGWCDERERLREALATAEGIIGERDATIAEHEAQSSHPDRAEADRLLNLVRFVADKSQARLTHGIMLVPGKQYAEMRDIVDNRHVNAPCTVVPYMVNPDVSARRDALATWDQFISRPRRAGKTAEAFVRGGGGSTGIDAVGLIAKIAPELVLETLGVNRKTFARTVENLRRARSENRTLRSAIRGVDRYVATAFDPWRD